MDYKKKYLKYKKKYLELKGSGNTFSNIINAWTSQIPNMSLFIKKNAERFEKSILTSHNRPLGKFIPYSSESSVLTTFNVGSSEIVLDVYVTYMKTLKERKDRLDDWIKRVSHIEISPITYDDIERFRNFIVRNGHIDERFFTHHSISAVEKENFLNLHIRPNRICIDLETFLFSIMDNTELLNKTENDFALTLHITKNNEEIERYYFWNEGEGNIYYKVYEDLYEFLK